VKTLLNIIDGLTEKPVRLWVAGAVAGGAVAAFVAVALVNGMLKEAAGTVTVLGASAAAVRSRRKKKAAVLRANAVAAEASAASADRAAEPRTMSLEEANRRTRSLK